VNRRRLAVGLVLVAQVLLACGGPGGSGSPTASAPGGGAPSGSASPSGAADTFQNPVIQDDFPDPHVIVADGTYYAYGTGHGYPIYRSTDLVQWESVGQAMPALGAWAIGDTWAPEVLALEDGYAIYYTARSSELKRPDEMNAQCVGVAVSDSPEGPFVDESAEPLVCQPDLGGTIDAHPFRDEDGKLYLIYKNDGNCCGQLTHFFIRPLTADGVTLTGEETQLPGLENDDAWEGAVIEAPTLHKQGDTYFMFYSANSYGGADYAVGYATATSVLGPYTDAPENPILATEDLAIGPGHQSIITDDDGDLWLTYHAWDESITSRQMWIDELVFEGGKARVEGPDTEPQPRP
jgi:beta-xylosidase